MLPDQCVLVSASVGEEDLLVSDTLGDEPEQQEFSFVSLCSTTPDEDYSLDSGEYRPCAELCFTPEVTKVVLDQIQLAQLEPSMVATMRVYVSLAAERAVVVKEDDLLTTKADIAAHPKHISEA
eukprot:3138321-Pyramimonas_sp.AAC.1